MVTCKECGYQNNGRKLCKKCGAPLDLSVEENAVSVEDLPDLTLYDVNRELKKLIRYFNRMQAQYSEYEYCNQKLDSLDKRGYVSKGILIFGICMIAAMVWLSVVEVLYTYIRQDLTGLLVWNAMFLAVGLYAVIAYFHSLRDNRKKIKNYLGREVELARQLTNHYKKYGPCLIDPQYTDPRILDRLALLIRSGRVNTLEQAMDTLFVDAGKTKKESSDYLAVVASRQAEFGEKDALVFCAASFFGAYHQSGENLQSTE